MENYFGTYARFKVPTKEDAGRLLSADNVVGDVYDIRCELEGSAHTAWLVNRFDQQPGYFDAAFSRQLSLLQAKGLVCKAILSFVAFTDRSQGGRAQGGRATDERAQAGYSKGARSQDSHYWGEVAVICYSPNDKDAFEKFIAHVSSRMGDGIRTRVDLDAEDVRRVIDSGGEWISKQTVPMPDKSQGMAIMKNRQKLSDKLVEQGRRGNKGCYVATFVCWAFLIALVVAIVFGIKACAGL